MPVRAVTLNATKAGITRLRTKGGASPETLYELTNGFVNASRCPQQRPGTTFKKNYGGSSSIVKGLCSFSGKLHTFCHTSGSTGDPNYVIDVLRHPTSNSTVLKTIHFAKPFMGFLYVVAEFMDGYIGHYWLQTPKTWTARTQYMDNDMVQPSVQTGYYYQAQRVINPPQWTPLLQYKADPSTPAGAAADRVQPTTYNGSYFIVNQVFGPGAALSPPISRSGSVEPNWALSGLTNGAFTLEFSTASAPPASTSGTQAPGQTPPGGGTGQRYSNRAGGFAKP